MSSSMLRTASYANFSTWDVKQFWMKKILSNYPVEKLGKHIVQQTEKVQLSDYPNTEFGILGVSNKIGMFDADKLFGKAIKQKYHIVKNDWLAYNPYRVNVGSVGLKTSEQTSGYISPAYIVFSCKNTLLPEYMFLLMKSNMFNILIRNSTTGTVRQTLGFDNLAEIPAPIPPINEQRKILDKYNSFIQQSYLLNEKADMEFSKQLVDIQSSVSSYGKEMLTKERVESLLNIISFASIDRWEVGYIYKDGVVDALVKSFKYPAMTIGELQKESLFGLSVKAALEQKDGMIPVLRMPNIKNGEVCCDELKYLPYDCANPSTEPDKWLLKKGDFLIARSNSKELVGKAAVFDLDGIYTYASYLIRYRFNIKLVLPEYVSMVFMTPIVREQINVLRRQGCEQYNLNSDEINSIRIPVPNIETQENIIQAYKDSLDKVKSLRKQAVNSIEKADNYIATTLFR